MKPSKHQPESKLDTDVGRSFTLKIEQHRTKPLWRFSEVETGGGKDRATHHPWLPFADLLPELALAHRRLQMFTVNLGTRVPQRVRIANE